jgi:GrpB-like predicted nucleotidyltransferase (UPF0157 family)
VGAPRGDDAAFEAWRARREREGERILLLDLYDEVARLRQVRPESLPLEERRELAARAMEVIWPGFEMVGTPRKNGPVVLEPWDPTWPSRFASWRAVVVKALGDRARRVDHIGSTAIPGLAAKPIVDVLVAVDDSTDETTYVPALEHAGIELYSRDDEHRFLVNAPPGPITVQVHVCDEGGDFERDHLLFRDYLLAHDDERDAYAAMKREAAAHWHEDRQGYTYAKSDLILDLLERAESWAAATGWTVGADPA